MAVFKMAWYTQLPLFRILLLYLIPTRYARPLSLSFIILVSLPPHINLGQANSLDYDYIRPSLAMFWGLFKRSPAACRLQFQREIITFEFPEKKSLGPNPESIRPRTKAWTAVLVITSGIPTCCSYQEIYLYLIFAQIVWLCQCHNLFQNIWLFKENIHQK